MGTVNKKRFYMAALIVLYLCFLGFNISLNDKTAYADEATSNDFVVPVEQIDSVPQDYIGIYTAEDLDNIRNDLNANYILMDDIDLSGLQWDPIGRFKSEFNGTLDGNGHRITSLHVTVNEMNDTHSAYAGLFGAVKFATFKNLMVSGSVSLTGIDVFGLSDYNVAGIAADASNTTFDNCTSDVSITTDSTSANLYVGGIAGIAYKSPTITNCINYGTIVVANHLQGHTGSDSAMVGGVVGSITAEYSTHYDSLLFCKNEGKVSVQADASIWCGGLAGYSSSGDISSCGSIADVAIISPSDMVTRHRTQAAGGLVGETRGSISSCYCIGSISVENISYNAMAGGIVGYYFNSPSGGVRDCYHNGDVSAKAIADGEFGSEAYAGGIIGLYCGSSPEPPAEEQVARCYSIGSSSAVSIPMAGVEDTDFSYASGIVAFDEYFVENNNHYISCYYPSSSIFSAHHVNDNDSGQPLSPSAMQEQSSFAGWDFENVWQMGSGDYPYPVLRVASNSQPPDSGHSGYPATEPLAQLAACELAGFNPGSSWVGQTVDDFLASAPFLSKDKTIWDGREQTYSDFFGEVLAGYEFVSAEGEGARKHVALKDPNTGHIVLALDPKGIITYADSFNSILQSDTKGCFDAAMDVSQEVRQANPSSPIHVTGCFLGGMAASYVSNTSGSPANVFNASAGYGAKLSWLTQGEFVDGNNFKGIDSPMCTNYYASTMRLLYGYGTDVIGSAEINANPNGSKYRLNSLYETTEEGYALCNSVQSAPVYEAKTYYIADTPAVLTSIANTVNNLDTGKPDLSFAKKSIQLTLGTTGKDTRLTGVDGAIGPYDMFLPQIIYTGSGDGDLMRGGQTADIFVAGSGSSRFIGNEGSDLYVIGEDADVRISDTCASDGNVLCKGLMGVMKTIVFTNLEQPDKVKDGLEDVLDSAVEILKDTKQDTIVFRNCSFADMEVTLVDAPFPNSDYYEIKAGTSTVQVQKRFFLKRDFLIIDASASGENARKAEGRNLEDLYREKNGKTVRETTGLLESDPATDASNAVVAHFQGTDVTVSVQDVATGNELLSLDSNADFDYCDSYGSFTCCGETGCVDAAYDATKVNVVLSNGTMSRIMTSPAVGSIDEGIKYSDGVDPSEFDSVEIRTDGDVRLVGMNGDGSESEIGTLPITKEDIDASTSAEAIDIYYADCSDIPDQNWTGNPITPSVEMTYDGILLEEGVDYALSYEQNTDAGEAYVCASGMGLFTGNTWMSFRIVGQTPEPGPDPQPAPAVAERCGGADRYKTMALVSQRAFPQSGSCGTVVVARGDNFPDALAAAGLAGVKGGQVLLTDTDSLTPETKAEIKRLGATKAYVLGDKNAVSDKTFGDIKRLVGGNAERVGGKDRIDTALKIHEAGGGGWGTTAIVATGSKAADALSASPLAYRLKAPIFLADSDGSLSGGTLDAIRKGGFDTVLVMGSGYSVSASAEKALKKHAATARFNGETRYETSKLTAEWALRNGFTCRNAVATAGREGKYADALVASSLGGISASPLLLVDDGADGTLCVSKVIAPHKSQAEKVYVLGDKNSVSDAIHAAIRKAIRQ